MSRHEVSRNKSSRHGAMSCCCTCLPLRVRIGADKNSTSLALCEIHFVVAALAMRVLPRMTLFETTEDDVLYDHDMFIPMVKAGSKGIRVTVS